MPIPIQTPSPSSGTFSQNTLTTASNQTYTAAQVVDRILKRDCNGAARTDVTPTASELIGRIRGARTLWGFFFIVANTSDADELLTITGGTGVTISGTATIPWGMARMYRGVITTPTGANKAVTLQYIGPSGTY